MKKVLLVIVMALLVAGGVVAMKFYKASQAGQRVKDLEKFVIPEGSFEKYLKNETLKEADEPAPLYELKVLGKDIISDMAKIVTDTSNADNVRCAAAIILGHTKKKAAVDPLVEALKEKTGRLGECASIMLNLIPSKTVPEKVASVLSSATDVKVRKNAFRAITFWVTIDVKRKENRVVMEEVIKGLKEKDKETLVLILRNIKGKKEKGTTAQGLQFNFFRGTGKEKDKLSEGEQLVGKLLPMIAHKDEEIAAVAAAALENQYSYMTDLQKVEAISTTSKKTEDQKKVVAWYVQPKLKKYVRVNAVNLLKKLNWELAQNPATINQCVLTPLIGVLDSDDPDLLLPALETFTTCGTEMEHRKAVKSFSERTKDENLKKKAEEAIAAIVKREEEG
ncbi:MAG: HEAT repeat domain-containing protein [Planctomycetota bacterium]|jgi:HEAT repeat protein